MKSYENALKEVVYSTVVKGNYPTPTPTIESQIISKRLEYEALLSSVDRGTSKTEYLTSLNKLKDELTALINHNDEIIKSNSDAVNAVNSKYNSDIEAAYLLESNKGTALALCINEQLNDTLWFTSKDCKLSTTQQATADTWRSNLMNVLSTSATIDEAIATYNSLIANKPNYKLKWK